MTIFSLTLLSFPLVSSELPIERSLIFAHSNVDVIFSKLILYSVLLLHSRNYLQTVIMVVVKPDLGAHIRTI